MKRHTGKYHRHKEHGYLIIAIGIIGGLLLFWFTIGQGYFQKKAMAPKPDIIKATFECDGSKTIQAEFSGNIVDLTLSDGRHMVLDQTVSADGARYATPDESVVFWNVGNTATLQEGDNTTFNNCVEKE